MSGNRVYKAAFYTNSYVSGYLKRFNPDALDDRAARVGKCEVNRFEDERFTSHECGYHGLITIEWQGAVF